MGTVSHLHHRNVLGEALEPLCFDPTTGFWRDGFCRVGPEDVGVHAIACVVTEEFLEYSKARGNDLSTPRLEWGFAGLRPGDRWCVCAARWAEALEAGKACPIILEATDSSALQFVSLADLRRLEFRSTPKEPNSAPLMPPEPSL